MAVSFDVTPEEARLIGRIAERAEGGAHKKRDALMDLTACHANGCRLRLAELLEAPELDFWHDVCGITAHLDRTTGELKDCFWPRFAKRTDRAGGK